MEEENTNINSETDNEVTNVAEDAGTMESAAEGENAGGGEGGKFIPEDALLERAVRAGMSLGDAISFRSKDMAERFIGMLEANGGKGGDKVNAGGNGDGEPTIDIDGFSEEAGYDPTLVKTVNSMKNFIEAQAKVIKELKAGNAAKREVKAVETRKNLILAKPGGERGRISSGDDAEADIINSLRAKFKLN